MLTCKETTTRETTERGKQTAQRHINARGIRNEEVEEDGRRNVQRGSGSEKKYKANMVKNEKLKQKQKAQKDICVLCGEGVSGQKEMWLMCRGVTFSFSLGLHLEV